MSAPALPDWRKAPGGASIYTVAEIGLSAFSMFFMGRPSFLGHRRTLAAGPGRSNCQTLFDMTAIPTAAYIRSLLDGAFPSAFDPVFMKALATEGVPASFERLNEQISIAVDGSAHFCSRKIHCPRCSTRKRSDCGTGYFHAPLGASVVAPDNWQNCRCRRNSSRPGRRGETGVRA